VTTVACLHVPATSALLDAWEDAQSAPADHRALLVLDTMRDDRGDELAEHTRGELNRLFLRARGLLFGEVCDAVADCGGCGAQLEASIPLRALTLADADVFAPAELRVGELRVRYRLPTWAELTALRTQSVDHAADSLLARCVTAIRSGKRQLVLAEIGDAARAAIDAAIGTADTDAVIEVELACPDCGRTCVQPMDPASFLWDEVNRWALSTLSEVAELAGTFGWSQEAILSMTPWRRRAYLSLAARADRPA
jgi:hypothetical protein